MMKSAPKRPMTRVAALAITAILAMSGGENTRAETGFTYTLVRDFAPPGSADESLCAYAFNDLGQVAYTTVRNNGAETVSLYFWDGTTSQLVYSAENPVAPIDPPYIFCGTRGGVGLNNDGLISAYGFATDPRVGSIGEGFVFFRLGQGLISTQFPEIGQIYSSHGKINAAGQVAYWVSGSGHLGTVSPNGSTFLGSISVSRASGFESGPTINDLGNVAFLALDPSMDRLALIDGIPNLNVRLVDLNPISQWRPAWTTPALNNLGYVGFATVSSGATSPPVLTQQFRVVLVGPDRTALSVLADDTQFTQHASAKPGISLNDLNEVLFGITDTTNGTDSLWLRNSADTLPLAVWANPDPLVIGSQTFTNAFFSANDEGPDFAVNNLGNVALSIYHQSPTAGVALVIAHPEPGLTPANPILPAPGDSMPVGFRIQVIDPCTGRPGFAPNGLASNWSRCLIAGIAVAVGSAAPAFIDPPAATAYTFTTDPGSLNFASILIPAPLPGGQSSFLLQTHGVSVPLLAGITFDLRTVAPDGVPSFVISGIDPSENLDPANPRAFVTGVTWVGTPGIFPASTSFTIVPTTNTGSDSSPPIVIPSVAGTAGTNGWYTSNVTVTWVVTDAESAISSPACGPTTVSTDTVGQVVSCTATSEGGTTSQSVTIKRDATPPTITISVPVASGSYPVGATVNANYTCTDLTSGPPNVQVQSLALHP